MYFSAAISKKIVTLSNLARQRNGCLNYVCHLLAPLVHLFETSVTMRCINFSFFLGYSTSSINGEFDFILECQSPEVAKAVERRKALGK